MSKPMTEARLSVIEYNHNDFTECYQYATVVNELLAEVRRLRECIAKAPHAGGCPASDSNLIGAKCSCIWQREALGE